jgi:uncharacterized membrane protein
VQLRAAAGKRRYSKHIRLIAFLVVFWGVYSFVITYRFYAEDNRHIWYARRPPESCILTGIL